VVGVFSGFWWQTSAVVQERMMITTILCESVRSRKERKWDADELLFLFLLFSSLTIYDYHDPEREE
jgi:hypothetical protein